MSIISSISTPALCLEMGREIYNVSTISSFSINTPDIYVLHFSPFQKIKRQGWTGMGQVIQWHGDEGVNFWSNLLGSERKHVAKSHEGARPVNKQTWLWRKFTKISQISKQVSTENKWIFSLHFKQNGKCYWGSAVSALNTSDFAWTFIVTFQCVQM